MIIMNGHEVSDQFADFWQRNGGIAIFGWPITPQRHETLADGLLYTVQYFERARFELHPEHAGTPFEIQLGRLGAELVNARTINPSITPPAAITISWIDRPHPDDYSYAGIPTISLPLFTAVLEGRESPVLDEAEAVVYYDECRRLNINPAAAIAFFLKESEVGTYKHSPHPQLAQAKNWGNLRPAAALVGKKGSRASGIYDAGKKLWHFARFDTWLLGLTGWCEYMHRRFPNMTIGQLLLDYAPEKDGNNPRRYARQVNDWIATWDKKSATFTIHPL